MFSPLHKTIQNKPKILFLIDGIGALISTLLLGIVLVQFQEYIGIPTVTLYILASLPLIFIGFDCYNYLKTNISFKSLKAIAYINLLYCIVSVIFACTHINTITYLGWLYLITEITILIILALLQLKTAKRFI